MLTWLNHLLIRFLEKDMFFSEFVFKNRESVVKSTLMSLCGFLACFLVLGSVVYFHETIIDHLIIISFIGLFVIFCIALSSESGDFIMFLVCLPLLGLYFYCRLTILSLHLVMPGFSRRNHEVLFFYKAASEEMARQNKILKEQEQIKKEKSKSSLDKKIELAETDFELFMEQNLPASQSLKRFIRERIKTNGALNYFWITLILTLPKDRFSIEGLKYVFLAAIQHSCNKETLRTRFNSLLEKQDFISNLELIDELFGDASEEKIKSWLTKQYTPDEYFNLFITKIGKNKNLNLSAKTIGEIVQNSTRIINNKFKNLEGNSDDLSYKILRKKSDYEQAKNDFKNCVLGYFDFMDVDIVCVYQNQNPIACVSISSDGKIKEIKAPYNRMVSFELKQIIISKILSSLQ